MSANPEAREACGRPAGAIAWVAPVLPSPETVVSVSLVFEDVAGWCADFDGLRQALAAVAKGDGDAALLRARLFACNLESLFEALERRR